MPKRIWTKEEEKILKKYYNEPDGICKIIELTNKNRKQILNKGKYIGYRIVNFSTKDENFFNIPNNLNSYISGFLSGDGWINKRKDLKNTLRQLLNQELTFEEAGKLIK